MTNPLFVADLATLQGKLRLTGVPASNTDVTAILDESILRARLAFYRRLPEGRVDSLLAITFEENPTTTDELLRALANTVEVRLVYCELLCRLPTAFTDNSGAGKNDWNQEALTREKSGLDLEKELEKCQLQIERDMAILAGEEEFGTAETIRTFNGDPDCPRNLPTAPIVGQSLNTPTRTYPTLTQDPPTL